MSIKTDHERNKFTEFKDVKRGATKRRRETVWG